MPRHKIRDIGEPKKKKSKLIPILLVLVALLSLHACAIAESKESSAGFESEQLAPEGTLGFTLTSDIWQPEWGDFTVVIRSMDGDEELGHEYYRADVGKSYSLDYGPGTYVFMLNENSATYEDQVFKAEIQTVDFDGSSDEIVTIPVVLDEEATAQRIAEREAAEAQAAEEARKAEEERAKAEAEAQAKAEAEAQAQREAEEQAKREAEAQSQAPDTSTSQENEQTVYITNTGKKYHNAGCRYLAKSKIPISLSDAETRGYTPCKVCH